MNRPMDCGPRDVVRGPRPSAHALSAGVIRPADAHGKGRVLDCMKARGEANREWRAKISVGWEDDAVVDGAALPVTPENIDLLISAPRVRAAA